VRRVHRGWLAAAALLLAACGSGDNAPDAAPEAVAVVVPTVAVAAQAPVVGPPPSVGALRILVTSADGVAGDGLDALVSTLAARPAVDVHVVATAVPDTTVGETGAKVEVMEDRTASGFPAKVVNASAADAVVTALDTLGLQPDLVIVGIDDGAAIGAATGSSPSVAAALVASRRGIPAIAVTVGDEHGADLAAAGLLLGSVLDLQLDGLLERPAASVLTVPSCGAGTVRGPVTVDRADDPPVAAPDCTGPASHHDDDVDAYVNGYATLTVVDR
jgi:5'-nucleotidase